MRSLYNTILIIVVLFPTLGHAQISSSDVEDIKAMDMHDHTFDPRTPKFLKLGDNAFLNYNPITLTFGGALYIYQKLISPQLQSRCPYEISCSAFSFASIQEFGIVKGVALTADRLTRCTQFSLIDILPSQINNDNGSIIDDPIKYRVKDHDHKH